jgi:hypothetical protein
MAGAPETCTNRVAGSIERCGDADLPAAPCHRRLQVAYAGGVERFPVVVGRARLVVDRLADDGV